MFRKFFNLGLFITLAITVGLAQQPAQQETPSVERLRAHIAYLASDKLEGRRTGSAGANLAAEYIAREFSRYGLRRSIGYDTQGMSILEADSPHRYMQEFPYVAGVEIGKKNILSVRLSSEDVPVDLKVAEDWMPLGFSSNQDIKNAPAVFVGYGIAASELKHDDYAGLDVTDKVAVALDRTPDGDNPHGQFARYEEPRWKVSAAKDKGAKALILLSQEEKFSDERLAKLRYDNAGEAGLPVVVLAKPAAMRLLQALALAVFQPTDKDKCGGATRMPDGTMVTPCTKYKLFKHPDGSMEVELGDGTKAPVGPDGRFAANKIYGPKELQRFSWSVSTDLVRHETPAYNVAGILPGSDPKLEDEAIVIGAHYDHLGRGGEGSLAPREGEIHHGADDNASGVAGVLELARIFSSQYPRPKRTLVFIAFSGEEEGLIGSIFYVDHPILPLARTVAMINMDMIGRLKDDKLIVGGVGTASNWREIVETANTFTEKISGNTDGVLLRAVSRDKLALTLNEDGYGPSDHAMFYAKQVPVLFFWTGTHDDYHKPSDTADKINYSGEARILSIIAAVIRDIDGRNKPPTYTVAKSDSTGRSTGFRVYLGTIPNYADSNDGLKLDGVRDDSPAAKAGLKAGDKVVKLAGHDVKNVYDYTYALGEMKAGQEYEVEVLRDGKRLTMKITPEARK